MQHRLALQRDCVHVRVVCQQLVDNGEVAPIGRSVQDGDPHSVHCFGARHLRSRACSAFLPLCCAELQTSSLAAMSSASNLYWPDLPRAQLQGQGQAIVECCWEVRPGQQTGKQLSTDCTHRAWAGAPAAGAARRPSGPRGLRSAVLCAHGSPCTWRQPPPSASAPPAAVQQCICQMLHSLYAAATRLLAGQRASGRFLHAVWTALTKPADECGVTRASRPP